MSIAYKIKNGSSCITCVTSANAMAISEVALTQPGSQNQIWQLIALFGSPNTYYFRNINDVYLRAISDTVVSGNIGNATEWVMEINQPITTTPSVKIRLQSDSSKYLGIGTNNSIVLVEQINAVNWDILEHDEEPHNNVA